MRRKFMPSPQTPESFSLLGDRGLDIVDRVIDEVICEFSEDRHRESLRHHFSTGGKKLRARLAIAAVNAFGGNPESGVLWGAACELLHNATLIHDDLQDGDRVRRGQPTVWAKYGSSEAINAGDSGLMFPYLALRTMKISDTVKWQLSQALASGAALTVRGQASELELPGLCEQGPLEKKYLQCISEKTSALFELPVTGAALISGIPEAEAKKLGAELKSLGLLFQMQDDILDLYGSKGREQVGGDLREGKVSCLVVAHLAVKPEDAKALSVMLAQARSQTSDDDVEKWIQVFKDSGALARAIRAIRKAESELVESLVLKSNPAFHSIVLELVDLALRPIQHVMGEH